jgi:hypothetical protein
MLRLPRLLFLVSVAAGAALPLGAQQPPPKAAPARHGTPFIPFIPAVPGVPVTVTLAVSVERPLPGGAWETLSSIALAARDSNGQTRHEVRGLEPASYSGVPPLNSVILFDPGSRTIQALDVTYRTDARRQVPPPADAPSAANNAETEDLGLRMIEGYPARGTRRTWRIPAELSPTGQPAQIVHETWYSDELKMNVIDRRTNPLGGVQEIAVASVDRNEPSAELFKVPSGYLVREQGRPVRTSTASGAMQDAGCSVPPASFDPRDPYSAPVCTGGFSFPSLPALR